MSNTEQIQRDFAAFADPASLISVQNREIRWVQNREQRLAYLGAGANGSVTLRYRERTYTYREFFASDAMADLRGLAESLPQYLRTLPSYVPEDTYVPAYARSEAIGGGSTVAESLLATASGFGLGTGSNGATRVVFLKGRAGDGKSSLLVAATLHAAEGYLQGATDELYFYIDAQGRALARVDEAIALILQDIRARFTYHAVSVLTRLGLIVPIIDGFDELLGPGGYQDAFSSLGRFLERLDGKGSVIASARSTFYQYTAFGQQSGRFTPDAQNLAYRIIPVDLEEWTERELNVLLAKRGAPEALGVADVGEAIQRLKLIAGDKQQEIFSSPFLATRLLELVAHGASALQRGSVVGAIVRDLVEREAVEKLRNAVGQPLLTVEDHLSLLGEIAEEMWIQQARELDEATFMTIVDIQCEDVFNLAPEDTQKVVNRMPAHALLARTDRPPRVSFRHEFYYAYFLGERLAGAARGSPGNLQQYLYRSPLSNLVAQEFADAVLRTETQEHQMAAVAALCSHSRYAIPRAMEQLAHQNAGTLLAAVVGRAPDLLMGQTVTNVAFGTGTSLAGAKLSECEFEQCEFEQADLRATQFVNVAFRECTFHLVIFDEHTKFDGCGGVSASSFHGLVSYVDGVRREEYDPKLIAERLRSAGAIQDGPVRAFESAAARALLEGTLAFLRVVRTSPYFSGQDFENRNLNLDRDFRDVTVLLRKHGLLADADNKSRAGTRKMYRITATADHIALGASSRSTTPEVEAFWNDVAMGAKR